MDLGATICTRTRPRCDVCPVADDCVARAQRHESTSCRRRVRARMLPQRAITVLLLERDGRILLERRPPSASGAACGAFPKLSRDADVATVRRAFMRAGAGAPRRCRVLPHGFTHFALTMHPVRVPIARWPLEARMPGVEWFARDAAIAAAMPAPIRRLLRDACRCRAIRCVESTA